MRSLTVGHTSPALCPAFYRIRFASRIRLVCGHLFPPDFHPKPLSSAAIERNLRSHWSKDRHRAADESIKGGDESESLPRLS